MKTLKTLAQVSVLVIPMATAHAATVTLSGTDVDFTFDDATLFGPGTVVGNNLFFSPPDFSAESLNGVGAAFTTENLIISVVSTTQGYAMTSFAMAEQGDYILDGAGASVAASGRLGVTSTTNANCASGLPFPFPSTTVCSDENIFNAGPFADTAGLTDSWDGSTSVDLADTANWGSDTSVDISFQNNLTATTLNTGEVAYIQKKLGAIGLIVNPVPVPAAVWLFGSGLLGLAAFTRRRKAA